MAAAVRVVEAQEAREKAERMSASVPKYNSPLPARLFESVLSVNLAVNLLVISLLIFHDSLLVSHYSL